MAFSDDIFLPGNHCEICGAELSDEVVIQEFADGSIARLCAECAAGAALQPDTGEFQFPDALDDEAGAGELTAAGMQSPEDDEALDETAALEPPAAAAPGASAPAPRSPALDPEALEKTRELLTPVVDLISLQNEMQGALQRLATSLQTFAAGVMTDNVGKSATVEERLEALECELEVTRERLRQTEALLAAAGAAPADTAAVPAPASVAAPATPGPATPAPLAATPIPAVAASSPETPAADTAAASSFWNFDTTMEATAEAPLGNTGEYLVSDSAGVPVAAQPAPPQAAAAPSAGVADMATQPYSLADLEGTLPPVAPPPSAPTVAPPSGPPTAEPHNRPGFQLVEVQIAQKYFNESHFTNRIRDVRKSLGKPKANLTKLVGTEPRALVTIAWDIIWYQYLVDLRRDTPTDQRVVLHREGMDLGELTGVFREKNASIDDEGRLDASELEVKLLSDPSTLITEMSAEEERALEDATEEIWDQKTAPEFKWDD